MEININGLDKLGAIIEQVLGLITNDYFYKQRTKNIINRIDGISNAVSKSSSLADVKFDHGGIQISALPNPEQIVLQASTLNLAERTNQRMLFQATNQQVNLENVVQNAANILKNDPPATNEPVDKDWSVRFFNIVKDVSNEELQLLWSKILAGEIKRPNSFSLRTLEIIRNLSKDEAIMINNIANYTFTDGESAFIPSIGIEYLMESKKLSHSKIMLLREIGILLHSEGFGAAMIYHKSSADSHFIFTYGTNKFKINFTEDVQKGDFLLDIRPFSTAGSEIISIINPEIDQAYLDYIVQNLEVREQKGSRKFKLKIEN